MAGGGGGGDYEVNINLTALLDVLTNLLFFLIFATQNANMEVDGGVILPESSAGLQPAKTMQMTIGAHDVRVDKEPIAQVQEGHVVGAAGSGRIEALYRRLMVAKEAAKTDDKAPGDIIMVFCDKNVSYALLHQVLNTAAEAGFAKFRMAVLKP